MSYISVPKLDSSQNTSEKMSGTVGIKCAPPSDVDREPTPTVSCCNGTLGAYSVNIWQSGDGAKCGATTGRWFCRDPRPLSALRMAFYLLMVTCSVLLTACSKLSEKLDRLDWTAHRVKFSHELHNTKAGMACGDCHSLNNDGALYAVAGHDVCSACHNIPANADPSCATCHAKTPGPVSAPGAAPPAVSRYQQKRYLTGAITFSHTMHNATKASDPSTCRSCHGDMAKAVNLKENRLPLMAECMVCHNNKTAKADCIACHPQLPSPYDTPDRLAQIPFPHPSDWNRSHGWIARAESAECQLCHQERTCEGCHQEQLPVDHQQIGWGNAMHGRKALFDRERCATCHAQPTCERCHNDAPATHSVGFMNPYDPSIDADGTRRHSLLGSHELRACMTCHDFHVDCATCHLEVLQ